MKKKHIITISGKPGSGKSSTADKVAEMLGYTRYSSGDMVRKVVKQKGMTLAEYNAQARSDHDLDAEVDEKLRELRDNEDVVIDSRLGFYWLPESFKVYLDLDMEVATARIYKDTMDNQLRAGTEGAGASLATVAEEVQGRMKEEQDRFRSLYGVDPYNTEHFDLVINTSRHSPQTVALTVFDTYREWLDSEEWRPRKSEIPLGYSFKNQY